MSELLNEDVIKKITMERVENSIYFCMYTLLQNILFNNSYSVIEAPLKVDLLKSVRYSVLGSFRKTSIKIK